MEVENVVLLQDQEAPPVQNTDTEQLTVPDDHTEQEQEDAQEEEDGNDTEEENQQIVVVDEDTAHLIHQDEHVNEAASEDSGMSSVGVGGIGGDSSVGGGGSSTTGSHITNSHHHHHHGGGNSGGTNGGLLIMPTSPISVTTASMSASDDMIENENEMLRDRVADLEKRVHDQNDEITCLRATLADCLRRINTLEVSKSHVQVNTYTTSSSQARIRKNDSGVSKTPQRRPMSGSYSSNDFNAAARAAHEAVNRRASYASNRDKMAAAGSKSNVYQSNNSLHGGIESVGGHQSSSSMSPVMSPSPTTSKPSHHHSMTPQRMGTPSRSMSGSVTNLTKRWSSTSDFRELSPGPANHHHNSAISSTIARRGINAGSLASLRSPFGSQQNLSGGVGGGRHHSVSGGKHGTRDAVFDDEEGVIRFYLRGRPISLVCSAAQLDTFSLHKVNPVPSQKLKLEWVYGYRGRDARANLQLLPTGEMVYFISAVVVLYNVEEQNQRHYLGHTQDIKCMSVHPNKLLIATGQAAASSGITTADGRPHIRVWNSVSLQTLHILGMGDFDRSLCCLSFSKADGGNLLVAVDEVDHNISIWDWQRGDRGHKITETKCSTETVVAAEFHPLDGRTIVVVGKGFVNFWQMDPNTLTLSRKTGIFDQRDKPKYVTCLAFSYTGDVITGDSNGNVFIWGRGYNAVTKVMRNIHDGPIFSVCVLKDGSIITGGGKDSRLVKFDTMYRKVGVEAQLPDHLGSIRIISQGRGSQLLIGTTKNSILTGNFDLNFQEIMVGHTGEVWALATNPSSPQFISAGHDRMIHLWDTLSHTVVWSNDVGEQAQSAAFSPDGEIIVVGTVQGKWVVLDVNTREVYGVHQDGQEPVHAIKFSPDGGLLAIGSRDNAIYIYQVKENYRKYNRVGRCMGHASHVTHLDWAADSVHLRSNSSTFDAPPTTSSSAGIAVHEVLFWNASVCRQVRDVETIRGFTWTSNDCPISWGTLGVWGSESPADPDVWSTSRNPALELLAAGDSAGKVRLYAYPASQPKSLYHASHGHSNAVTRVSWLSDGSKLVSAGGRDNTILQWRII